MYLFIIQIQVQHDRVNEKEDIMATSQLAEELALQYLMSHSSASTPEEYYEEYLKLVSEFQELIMQKKFVV